MSAFENQLQALLDREAIRDLPKRYCDRVWQDDPLGVSALFTADGEFQVVMEEKTIEIKGRDAILDFMREGLADRPRPYIHNLVIESQQGDHATGRAYLDLRSAKHHFDWLGAGYYEDTYVKQTRQWFFARRVFHALRIDDWPGELDKAN